MRKKILFAIIFSILFLSVLHLSQSDQKRAYKAEFGENLDGSQEELSEEKTSIKKFSDSVLKTIGFGEKENDLKIKITPPEEDNDYDSQEAETDSQVSISSIFKNIESYISNLFSGDEENEASDHAEENNQQSQADGEGDLVESAGESNGEENDNSNNQEEKMENDFSCIVSSLDEKRQSEIRARENANEETIAAILANNTCQKSALELKINAGPHLDNCQEILSSSYQAIQSKLSEMKINILDDYENQLNSCRQAADSNFYDEILDKLLARAAQEKEELLN